MNGFYPEGTLYNKQENKKHMLSPAALLDAQVRGIVLEAAVLMCDTDHNLIVNLGCMRGIIPRNEGAIGIESGATRDIALISRVGKPVCFVISEIKSDSKGDLYAVLSRKKAQMLCKSYIESEYKTGRVVNAVVTHLESFGAFCDIGCGNIALLPIDAISVSRISHPKDRFHVGDNIKAVVKNVAADGKITLSHKELLGTWEENACEFAAGQTVTGVVRSVEDYGIFVEITPNLAGLAEPRENVRVGQQASVFIKSILKDKMKIKLIIIDCFESNYIPKIKYYNNADIISEWEYSPKDCRKRITTRFCG
jgi:small subunit ribosomal protein S1